MSITHSLSNALSGLTASARMAEVVSSNVANALTDGYGRRSVDLTSAVVGGRGAGVEIGGITRHVDRGIIADRRLADADLAASSTLVSTLSSLQDIVGQVGVEGSISSRITSVEAALVDAASDSSSEVRLTALANRLSELTDGLNTASGNIQRERERADASIASQVETLNASLEQLEQLNGDISYSINTGGDPSPLLDARQNVIDTISEIVPVRELQRENGRVALMTPEGQMLIDGRAKSFGFVENVVITPDMTLASGGLSGLTLDGSALEPDGIGRMAGGSLGASFAARDDVLVSAQAGLDDLAADLISRFQDNGLDGTIAPGGAGVLTDRGAAFLPANTTGLAGRISLNIAVDPNRGGAVTNLRDGVNATAPGPAGNSTLLRAMSDALSDPRASTLDPVTRGAAERAGEFEAGLGSQRLTFEAELGFQTARWSSLKEAEAADGVDTDYEMQMLLRIEQAYAANARVIQTVNSLMQRLMEI
ncbi:flagellar hook-associated protein FlgK [Pseudooctadecabacter jejudonensis]|uniref:Flagellar hook-associated protein 1 n=1 Tax=Pseudooctadecabacter jejudonensis TaxID=1391910 RepID=A0A1Y5S442_9RHOB|nr:flagellar hook-associated protein FlgK [Pseudooctadecabacter jejudonensis]SLN32187.1 Flagellar hook-associated protein 1 [Pseudooctadecabacter jejudonensis]